MNPELKPTSKIELNKQPSTTDVAKIVTNQPEMKQRREGFSTREKVLATIGALGLLGGGAAAANHLSSNAEHSTDRDSSTAGPIVPGAVETGASTASAEPSPLASPTNTAALETAQPIEAAPTLELSVDKYADKDTLAKAIVEERMSAWYMEGTTEENQESYYTRPEPWTDNDFTAAAEKASVPYINTLFTDDWSAHPESVEFIQRAKEVNAQSMYLNLGTSKFGGNPENIEPYAINLNVTAVQEAISENGNRLLIIDYVTNDNTERNTADEAMTKSIDNTAGSWKLELKQEGGVYKIASATL